MSYFDSLSENKKMQIVLHCAVPYFANTKCLDYEKFIGFISEKISNLSMETGYDIRNRDTE